MSASRMIIMSTLAVAACAAPQAAVVKAPSTAPSPSQTKESPNAALKEKLSFARTNFASKLRRFRIPCGKRVAVTFDWTTFDQRAKAGPATTVGCTRLLGELTRLCRITEGRAVARIASLKCVFGEQPALALEKGTLQLTSNLLGAASSPWVRKALMGLPFGPQASFGEAMARESTRLCLDGERRILVGHRFGARRGISVGEGGAFVYLGEGKGFGFQPMAKSCRFSSAMDDGRFSPPVAQVSIDLLKKTCTLGCGKKTKALKLADYATTQRVLASASYKARPDVREPHALARDKRGRYYYVDSSSLKKKTGDFRVYVGRRGKLVRQKMVDVVSDSEGQIFATKRGKLRLWVGKKEALWIKGRRRKKLTRVPIDFNLPLIFNELGVYWGKKRHTPCDDF